MKFFIATTISVLLLISNSIHADPIKDINESTAPETSQEFSKCLETDSIACLQLTLFRKARSIFENPQIELFGGVSLVHNSPKDSRQGKALDPNAIAVEVAPSVEARNTELSNYFLTNAKKFFAERSLNFNFANAARSVARAVPDDIKADLRELVVESRTKKKKLIKKLLPILLGVGAKIAILGVGAIIGLIFLAKKALIVSVIAFILSLVAGASSGFGNFGSGGGLLGGLGGLFGGKNSGAAGVGAWSAGGSPSGGWSTGGAGWDAHGAYSSPVGQTLAYSGYKQ